MITMRRCGSIGRNTNGGIAGAAGTTATAGGAGGAAAGGRAASFGAGAGLAVGGLPAAGAGGADAMGAAGAETAGAGRAGAATTAGGGGEIALTAAWQPPESLPRLRLRHSRASLPPGVTPEQFAMKSERQFARMALVCAGVGCCAIAD